MTHAQTADIDAAIQKVISAVDATVHALAGIGQYLADTWGNLNDCEREELEAELSELRSLKSKGVAA